MAKPATPDPDHVTPFDEQIRTLFGGRINDELTARLAEAVEATTRYDDKSTVTLKMEIVKSGEGSMILFTPNVDVKIAKPKPRPMSLWVGNGGTLHAQDPFQGRMFDDESDAEAARPPMTEQ